MDGVTVGLEIGASTEVLAGEGKHFSAGHDIGTPGRDIDQSFERKATLWWDHVGKEGGASRYARESEVYVGMCRRWREIPKPTIAMVQGKCIAGGLMVALMCDLIIAADDAVFQNPVLRMTGAGVEALVELRGMSPRMAKAFLWTAQELDAQEAHRQLLINEVVPRADLEMKTMALAERIAKLPPVTAQNVKRSINHAEDLAGFRNALEYHFMVHQFQHNTKTSLDALADRMQKGSMKEVFSDRDEGFK